MSGEVVWYISRAGGIVSLVLFTAVMVLGIVTAGRAARSTSNRAVLLRVHRSLTLVALSFLAIHIVTAIADGYVDLTWVDVVVPFVSAFDPLWIGLGAIAVDLLLAVAITSVFRRHLPRGLWRVTHLASYAMWPIAVLHGVFTEGGDGTTAWALTITGMSVISVVVALAFRLSRRTLSDTRARRLGTHLHARVAVPISKGVVR